MMDFRILELAFLWLYILVIVMLMLQYSKFTKRWQVKISIGLCIVFTVYYAVRNLGLDLPNYALMYANHFARTTVEGLTSESLLSNSYEPGNYILGYFLGVSGFRIYLLLLTLFTCLVAAIISSKQDNPLLYYGSFLLLNCFSPDQTRQFGAEGFLLLSYLIPNTLFAFIVAMLSGIFHYGAMPASLAILLRGKKLSQVAVLAFIVLGIPLCAVLMALIPDLFANIEGLSTVGSKVGTYSTRGLYATTDLVRLVTQFLPSIMSICFIVYFSSRFKVNELGKLQKWALNSGKIAAIFFMILLFGAQSDAMATRIFSAANIGLFILVGFLMENNATSKCHIGILLWLVFSNILSTSYLFYSFVS